MYDGTVILFFLSLSLETKIMEVLSATLCNSFCLEKLISTLFLLVCRKDY